MKIGSKKYKLRKGSIAYYVHKSWKPVGVLASVGLIVGCLTSSQIAEPIESEPVEKPVVIEEVVELETWNVPLEKDLQLYIAELCEEVSIEPELVFAVIEQESCFEADTVGDNGKSFGLMQVQARWHKDRMVKLGSTDLLDPYDNVLTGIDILAEKIAKYDTIGEALTAYNAGDTGAYNLYFSKGVYANGYAEEVIAKAEEFKAGE